MHDNLARCFVRNSIQIAHGFLRALRAEAHPSGLDDNSLDAFAARLPATTASNSLGLLASSLTPKKPGTPPKFAIDSIRNQQAKPEHRCHPLEHGEQGIGTGIAGRSDAPATKAAGFPWAKTAFEPDQAGGYGGQLAAPVAAVGIDLGTSDDAEFRQHRFRANALFETRLQPHCGNRNGLPWGKMSDP